MHKYTGILVLSGLIVGLSTDSIVITLVGLALMLTGVLTMDEDR